jgi:hypothetical protein
MAVLPAAITKQAGGLETDAQDWDDWNNRSMTTPSGQGRGSSTVGLATGGLKF